MMDRRQLGKLALGAAGLAGVRVLSSGGTYSGSPDLTGKVVVITGGNSGLGLESGYRLAKMGAEVVLGCRSMSRGSAAVKQIEKRCAGSCKVQAMQLDLASFGSIEAFADAFKSKYNKCDVLMNNAGVMALPTMEMTEDGIEKQLGINHFGHFLLTNLLFDRIAEAGRAGDARVVNVASLAHVAAVDGVNLEQVGKEKDGKYSPWGAYSQSKVVPAPCLPLGQSPHYWVPMLCIGLQVISASERRVFSALYVLPIPTLRAIKRAEVLV